MAATSVNSWFQSWAPPSPLLPDLLPETNVDRLGHSRKYTHYDSSESNMPSILPFLLALGTFQHSHQDSIKHPLHKPSHHSPAPHLYYTSSEEELQDLYPLEEETTGPFTTVYSWKLLDFDFPSEEERMRAISNEEYIQKNNLPLGIETWKNKVFLSMPKWKPGVPATLAWLPRKRTEMSPKLKPYPNWDWHTTESCSGLTSVFRMQVDTCGRLWVLDSGQIEVTIKPKQVCPPQILVFDLKTDRLIRRHVFKKEYIKQDSLYSNIVVDIRDNCEDVHAYVTDVWRFGLLVYSLKRDHSWRVTNHLFYPDPLAATYKLHDLEFSWTDGIFGVALSPYDKKLDDRILYFHPMSSFREFYVKTSIVCNETAWDDSPENYKVLGQSRGKSGHASASAMDKNGILFFNYVSRDAIGCWDSRKSYKRENIGVIAKNNTTLVFPNDLRLDKEKRQGIWIITNRLPFYLYKSLNENDINFRVMHAYVDEAIKGTICDPLVARLDSYNDYYDEEDCY